MAHRSLELSKVKNSKQLNTSFNVNHQRQSEALKSHAIQVERLKLGFWGSKLERKGSEI